MGGICMSIKAKLSASISLIVAFILMLNMIFIYISAKHTQAEGIEQQLQTIAKQLAVSIENFQHSRETMEYELARELRLAALVAKDRLSPDIADVTNEQLEALRDDLKLNDITLWQRIDGKNISVMSTNPEEIGLRSESWDYWDTAFHQLFNLQQVKVDYGIGMDHYWSGPINYAASNPDQINKWGYYYDGTANYMINTIMDTNNLQYDLVNGTNAVIEKMLSLHPSILEISGFSPEFFGKKRIIKMKKGVPIYNLDVRDVPFGTYTYSNTAEDSVYIQNVLENETVQTIKFQHEGIEVRRSFIPIPSDKPYVIGVAFSEEILGQPLRQELLTYGLISIALVLLTMAASYFIAGYMLRSLRQIMDKVTAIANGNFRETIIIRNKDELGSLADRVNVMGSNLDQYTTRLKDAAAELQHTKQYLESFVGHTSDAIHVVDLDGHITQVNKAFVSMFGWSEEEVMDKPPPNIPEDKLTDYEQLMDEVLRGGTASDFETVRFTKDGRLIDVSMTVSPIRDEQEHIVAVATITRNITSRKQAEEMLRRSEKLSVVGQLAAGVAHEIRNPLTTLVGFVQLQKTTGQLSDENLDLMLEELDRINMIVSEFLVLAKPQANRYDYVLPGELIKDIMLLLDSEARKNNVCMSLALPETPIGLKGVANQLKQVFVNVIKNGIEAMQTGGRLQIELKPLNDEEVAIIFSDQGSGIAEDDLARLGEPFFSTKEGGNGLGIMVSQQIIANHRGVIRFKSSPGEGTRVEIVLPIQNES